MQSSFSASCSPSGAKPARLAERLRLPDAAKHEQNSFSRFVSFFFIFCHLRI
nr:MAG TPA: hypothetical protein [Caudoviricetes sp.]